VIPIQTWIDRPLQGKTRQEINLEWNRLDVAGIGSEGDHGLLGLQLKSVACSRLGLQSDPQLPMMITIGFANLR
jgi:hypothetical protein